MLRKAAVCIHAGAAKGKAQCGENVYLQGVKGRTEGAARISTWRHGPGPLEDPIAKAGAGQLMVRLSQGRRIRGWAGGGCARRRFSGCEAFFRCSPH